MSEQFKVPPRPVLSLRTGEHYHFSAPFLESWKKKILAGAGLLVIAYFLYFH